MIGDYGVDIREKVDQKYYAEAEIYKENNPTLNEMAKQSKKKFVVNKIPINKDLDNYLKNQKIDSKSIVFHGGEEYEFVFTIPSKFKAIIMKNAKLLKNQRKRYGNKHIIIQIHSKSKQNIRQTCFSFTR